MYKEIDVPSLSLFLIPSPSSLPLPLVPPFLSLPRPLFDTIYRVCINWGHIWVLFFNGIQSLFQKIGVSGTTNSDGIPSIQSARRVILSTKRPRSYHRDLNKMRDLDTLFGNMHLQKIV